MHTDDWGDNNSSPCTSYQRANNYCPKTRNCSQVVLVRYPLQGPKHNGQMDRHENRIPHTKTKFAGVYFWIAIQFLLLTKCIQHFFFLNILTFTTLWDNAVDS